MDGSVRPAASFRLTREPILHVRQKTNMVCWAAAGTMICSARDQMSFAVETIMGQADTRDPGYGYLTRYQENQGLPPNDTGRYTRAIGLRVGPPASFSVQGWRSMMAGNGAFGVVGLTPYLHIRVVTEMAGDGSPFGTLLLVHDPGMEQPYREVFQSFAEQYEDAATISHRMDQIWHR